MWGLEEAGLRNSSSLDREIRAAPSSCSRGKMAGENGKDPVMEICRNEVFKWKLMSLEEKAAKALM